MGRARRGKPTTPGSVSGAESRRDEQSPSRISHFEILEPLGSGGMAVVYKARDLRLGRLVALKFLAPGMETSEEARLRFLLEARAISALDHPNVCTLYEIGETDDGRMFLAMAYVEGGTLRDQLREGPLEPIEAALLTAQVAEGLGAAHARGIVHRDIKPGKLRQQSDPVSSHHPGTLNALLVIGVALLWRQAGHADIDTRFVRQSSGIGGSNLAKFAHGGIKEHHINTVVMPRRSSSLMFLERPSLHAPGHIANSSVTCHAPTSS